MEKASYDYSFVLKEISNSAGSYSKTCPGGVFVSAMVPYMIVTAGSVNKYNKEERRLS